ncbi:DgyrCDS2753 [Dimorphilus gyrociliatus]|uniref:DgyrCDS2753 n=1 Tax=Dimorphilus gyrociliatus TaxID=2664684 RepID=A0A7I8VCG9_9ANNE|nr:DgyrCDS2753 [Dimorphilus gyrociliatus]
MKDPQNFKEIDSYAWGLATFRGEPKGQLKITKGYKADWRLVPRHEEDKFRSYTGELPAQNVIPTEMNLPPLLEYLEMSSAARKGNPMTERPKIPLIRNYGKNNRAISDSEQKILDGNL